MRLPVMRLVDQKRFIFHFDFCVSIFVVIFLSDRSLSDLRINLQHCEALYNIEVCECTYDIDE